YQIHATSLYSFLVFFVLYCDVHHPDLHSFPTRRSSDLGDKLIVEPRGRITQTSPPCRRHRSERLSSLPELVPFVTGEGARKADRSEEHTSELQSRFDLVCRLLLEKKKYNEKTQIQHD